MHHTPSVYQIYALHLLSHLVLYIDQNYRRGVISIIHIEELSLPKARYIGQDHMTRLAFKPRPCCFENLAFSIHPFCGLEVSFVFRLLARS